MASALSASATTTAQVRQERTKESVVIRHKQGRRKIYIATGRFSPRGDIILTGIPKCLMGSLIGKKGHVRKSFLSGTDMDGYQLVSGKGVTDAVTLHVWGAVRQIPHALNSSLMLVADKIVSLSRHSSEIRRGTTVSWVPDSLDKRNPHTNPHAVVLRMVINFEARQPPHIPVPVPPSHEDTTDHRPLSPSYVPGNPTDWAGVESCSDDDSDSDGPEPQSPPPL